MSTRAQWQKIRVRAVQVLVILMGAIGVGVFWRDLTAWFSPKAEATRSTSKASATSAPSAPTVPPVHFDDATLERLRAAFSAYEQVRALLAKDEMAGLAAQAQALRAALTAASTGDAPSTVAESIAQGSAAAGKLAEASEAEAARRAFGELSTALLTLASADPRLAEGLHVFTCPMADGFGKWFQPSPDLENPYMGKRMLTCGAASDWSPAPPDAHSQAADGGGTIAYYTCSMHPSVRQHEPGGCPICGMDLTPVTHSELESGTILVDEIRRQRIGVRTSPVTRRNIKIQIRAVGRVRYDETRLSDVSPRVSGWIKNLKVNETGQRVRRGEALFSLYSPELYAAQLEHLTTTRRQSEGASDTLANLKRASRQRLHLLGLTEAQIDQLESRGEAWESVPVFAPASGFVIEKNVVEGARVESGARVYRIADLSRIWVDAEVYESDLPRVRVGQPASVRLPYLPDQSYQGRVDYIYPSLDGQSRTGRIRVVLDNPSLELKLDMYANVELEVDLGEHLAIPDSAVIYTGPRRLVFVDMGEGRLRPKPIQVGAHAGAFYEVTEGLAEGEVVVTSGNFLIAAESRIRSATGYWGSDVSH